jgi:hypothetical protein
VPIARGRSEEELCFTADNESITMLGKRLFAFVVGTAFVFLNSSHFHAQQPPPPWTGILANEARSAIGVLFGSGSNDTWRESLSADGRFVVFHSSIPTLVADDTNNWNDVFVRDRVTGTLTRVSVATDGTQANNTSAYPVISDDGRHIAFQTCATNLDPADTNDRCDIYVRDLELNTTVRVSLGPSDEQILSSNIYFFSLSADGRYVVFSGNFETTTWWGNKIWLRDRDPDENGVFDEAGLSTTTLIMPSTLGTEQLFDGDQVSISADGRFIAYSANTMDAGSNLLGYRMYLHDRQAGTTVRVDRPTIEFPDVNAYSSAPHFSEAGHLVYGSNAPYLVEGDTDLSEDVFVFNIFTGGHERILLTHSDPPPLLYRWTPSISADGRYLAFMGATDDNGYRQYHAFAFDRQIGMSYELSLWPDGTRDGSAGTPWISADGSSIAFSANPQMLVDGYGNNGVFVVTNVALSPSEIDVPESGDSFQVELTAPANIPWSIPTQYLGGDVQVTPSSGVGPATLQVDVQANQTGNNRTLWLMLGSELVTINQSSSPVINYIAPMWGSPVGGEEVQINGSAFQEGAAVTFGGTPATNVVFVDSQNLTVTTPAHTQAGPVPVVVTNPDGTSVTMPDGFYYMDTTPPVITPTLTGTQGLDGWYVSDVSIAWTIEDPESEAYGTCNNETHTTDTPWINYLCFASSAGGQGYGEAIFKRDATPPVIYLAAPEPRLYVQGEVASASFVCSDETSGIASCTGTQPSGANLNTSSVGTHEFTVTTVDHAGHQATQSVTYTVKTATALGVPDVSAPYGSGTQLRATLFGNGAPLAGKTLAFSVGGQLVGTAVTSPTGEAQVFLALDGRNAGVYSFQVEFAGDATTIASTAESILTVEKLTPQISWPNPAFIAHGTPLGATQLNASTTVPGTFAYKPAAGTVLTPGTHTLATAFTPQDLTNYNSATKTVTLKVKAVPEITWATPAPIRYPTALTSTQLNATADVAGTFSYNPPAGFYANPGPLTVTATFTPANLADYVVTTATVTLQVLKGIPTITWPSPAQLSYGFPLTSTQLNATASASGTFDYTPPAGTVLPVGTHTLSVAFTPNDQASYESTTGTTTLVVIKRYPPVWWSDPAPIVYGTPLSATQLNATSTVAGTFTYDPPAGSILDAGTRQIVLTFTPEDQANYHTVTHTKDIVVQLAPTTVTWANPANIVYGTALGATQLNATSSVPGTFNYSPGAGAVLNAGLHSLYVSFTPTNPNYAASNGYVSLVVEKRTPVITWVNPAPIVYGTALGWTQYNATVDVGGGGWTFDPPIGTVLNAGAGQSLRAIYEPSSLNYNGATATVAIDVLPGAPVITWVPNAFMYGTALDASHLDATANMPGTFTYSHALGTVLPAGQHTLTATFTPTDSNYAVTTHTALFTVWKRTPTVIWNITSAIYYATPLSGAQLNATADAPGTFSYSQTEGTILNAGTHTLSVTFTPSEPENYNQPGPVSGTLEVLRALPVINWPTPGSMTYGTALSGTQFNATANVAGTFSYSPAAGTILSAGTHTLMTTFTPSDTANYMTAFANVSLVVGKATPTISWPTPAAITYGTALSTAQLNATADTSGTFAYSPVWGSVLAAGSQVLTVTFTPSNANNFTQASANVTLTVGKATPVVSWSTPAAIVYGTALSATQLNATANVAGTFTYSPSAGTVPAAGSSALSASFTPSDTANYNGATGGTTIAVTPKALTIQTNPTAKVYGEALPVFSATGTGFVNGDTLGSLSGALSFATTVTTTSAPGSYLVTPSGVFSPNYSLSFVAGTLTVTKAATSLSLVTTPNPSTPPQNVEVQATVSAVAPGAGVATGTVEFRDNGVLLGSAPLVNGVATITIKFKKGAHPLTATYAGDANFTGSSGTRSHQTN